MYALAHYRYVKSVSSAAFPDLERHGRARFSLHPVARILALKSLYRCSVYLDYLVTAHKSVLMCRRTEVRLVDYHIFFLLLMYDRAYSAVGLGHEHLKIFVLLFGNINGIWVEFFKHGVYACSHYPVYRKRVHI